MIVQLVIPFMVLQKIYKINFQRHLQKKKKNDLENDTTDDEDFHEEGSERHSFNKSMIEINPKWTPIKYQLRTDLNVVSVKKSFFKKVIKQLKAYLK